MIEISGGLTPAKKEDIEKVHCGYSAGWFPVTLSARKYVERLLI